MSLYTLQVIQSELDVFREFAEQFVQLANGSEPGEGEEWGGVGWVGECVWESDRFMKTEE